MFALVPLPVFAQAQVPANPATPAARTTVAPNVQTFPADATLSDIRLEGIESSVLQSLVRVRLVARPGMPLKDIDLSAERNRIYNMGSFSQVSLSVLPSEAGPVLHVKAVENPPIDAVVLRGVNLFDKAQRQQIEQILAQQNLLSKGQVYNSTRAQEGVVTLQNIYRQVGFPGNIPITLDVKEKAQKRSKALRVVYTVNEKPPVDEVKFSGSTVLDEGELSRIFAGVGNAEAFDLPSFVQAEQAVSERYKELGFRGSGVDAAATQLANGILDVRLRELKILSIDTSAIGIPASDLSLKPGDLYNYDTLLKDIARVAKGRQNDIRFETSPPVGDRIQVIFASGPPASAGPIRQIAIEGNTVFSDAELRLQLQLKVGQTFTSALAAEDFTRLQNYYAEEGYLLVPQVDFNFRNGTYIQRLKEVKIAGYQVDLGTPHPRTERAVITRYLPEVGTIYNQQTMERGIIEINQLQILQLGPVNNRLSHALIPTKNPQEQIVRFIAREMPTRTITPSAELSTEGGVSFLADIAVSDKNLWGQAHSVSASINTKTSDIGFLAGGSLSYNVPWLYVDFLDFKKMPTSVSGEIYSTATTNQPLTKDGRQRIHQNPAFTGKCAETDPNFADCALIGEYTQRDTGFRVGLGRLLIPNLTGNLSAKFTQSDYMMEPPKPARVCKVGAAAKENENCYLPEAAGLAYLPQSGFSSYVGSSLAFDNRDNPQFARAGYRVNLSGGVGFGNDYETPEGVQQGYTYEQLETGARTYLTPFKNRSHIFAFRIDAGHQFGAAYPDSRLFIVGNTNNEATQIRGYRTEDIDPSKTYLTGSAEYRYDFGLSTPVTQTIVGIGFIDAGYASSVSYDPEIFASPMLLSAGVAVQLNIGFGGGLAIPPLRFDYGFSPKHPTGVFGFRLGFNF